MKNKVKIISVALFLIIAPLGIHLQHKTKENFLDLITSKYEPINLLSYFYIKHTLKTFDWKKSGIPETITRNWDTYTEDQSNSFKDRKILKKGNIKLLNKDFTAELRIYNNTERYELLLLHDYKSPNKDYEEKFCSTSAENFKRILGTPQLELDLSSYQSEDFSTIDTRLYWELGNTRISYDCALAHIYKDYIPMIVILHIGSKEDKEEMKPVKLLKCSMKQKWFGALDKNQTEDQPPFTITIDPNRKTIRSETLRLGDTSLFNDKEIISTLDEAKLSAHFRLDRVGGSYTWKTTSKELKGTGIDRWGDCEQINSTKKF